MNDSNIAVGSAVFAAWITVMYAAARQDLKTARKYPRGWSVAVEARVVSVLRWCIPFAWLIAGIALVLRVVG